MPDNTSILQLVSENPFSYVLAFQAGQQFEATGDYLRAYICYRRADHLCDSDEEKEFVKTNVQEFYKAYKMKIDRCQFHQLVTDEVIAQIGEKNFYLAYSFLMSTVFENNQISSQSDFINNDLMILHILLTITLSEADYCVSPILTRMSTMEEIRTFYYRLKFYMRRVQVSLPDYLQFDLFQYIEQNDISDICLAHFTVHMEMVKYESFKDDLFDIREKIYKRISITKPKTNHPVTADPEHTFSFILCVNNREFLSEITIYINNLEIPTGYAIEILPIFDAKSMTSGYNQGMKKARGKYKIYLHQDIFLIHRFMLREILELFAVNQNIGMIGIAGCTSYPSNGIWWNEPKTNTLFQIYVDRIYLFDAPRGTTKRFVPAEIIDGVLMITSKDIPWREDLFEGWHFYDASQSQEFIRNGYQVIIPQTKNIWALHDTDFNGMLYDATYETNRKIFLNEYGKEKENGGESE
ncbi:MAG: glycosyltransferase family protein [Lachnoclostridium sp.]|jgi:hypothetical protein|nr:glycosyltransferase family protein [Lachnoclostridium sp.]